MEPRIVVLTLGVTDLERSLAFYRDGLGFPTQGIIGTEYENGTVAFFELTNGLIFALYPRTSLGAEARVEVGDQPAHQFTIGHNVRTREQVDAVINQARAAGAHVLDEPHDRPWGIYSGHFEDPDGHIWEIVWNPELIPS